MVASGSRKQNDADKRNLYGSRQRFCAHRSCLAKQEVWRQAALTSVALLVVEELPRATGIDQEKNVVVFFLVILAFALICLD